MKKIERMLKSVCYLFVISVFMIYCSSVDLTDTSSGSEVTNGIMGKVVSAGANKAGVQVFLIRSDSWEKDVISNQISIDSIETGSDGKFRFTDIQTGEYTVLSISDDSSFIEQDITVDLKSMVDLDILELTPSASVSGKVRGDSFTPTAVRIKNTHLNSPIAEDGSFRFISVPSDEVQLYAEFSSEEKNLITYARGLFLHPGSNIENVELKVISDGIMLDDFNDGIIRSNLDWLTGSSYWYAYTEGEGSVIEPENLENALSEENAYEGRSLSVRFILSDSTEIPYASVGCRLGNQDREYVDFSDLKAISFMMRGTGTVRMNLITALVDKNEQSTRRGDFGVVLEAQDWWQLYTIGVEELMPEPDSRIEEEGKTWQDAKDSVRAIVFGSWAEPGSEIELGLDNIFLIGIDQSHFAD
ncbi:hypothetical protein CHISP_1880 [Chitinispirillum alkaliphilum]|nr:hypothetical protein CHISP_1880 [Chitinispirillum alkaliphilum]